MSYETKKLTNTTPSASPEQLQEVDLRRPIPEGEGDVAGWKEIPLKENEEPLVALGAFSDKECTHNPFGITAFSAYSPLDIDAGPYRGERELEHSLTTLFVRSSVAERLQVAQAALPEGHHLVVLDAFRTLETQQALYAQYYDALARQNPEWSADELSTETQKYVSLPSSDPDKPSPHNTGGSVDLAIYTLEPEAETRVQEIDQRVSELTHQIPESFTPKDEAEHPILKDLYVLEMEKAGIIRKEGRMLDFGTPFDYGGKEAALRYLEEEAETRELTPEEAEAQTNRRMLYSAMTHAGMEPYADEWWHFNAPESQMGAQTAGRREAEFGGQELSPENRRVERVRSAWLEGVGRIFKEMERGIPSQIGAKVISLEDERLLSSLDEVNRAGITAGGGNPNATPKNLDVDEISPPEESAA